MTKLEILCIPKDEKTLRNKSEPILAIDKNTKKLISDMLETLRTSERPGVGLAAPQVGHNVRLVVIESDGWNNDKGELVGVIPKMILINPVITKFSEEKEERFEGCLSVPEYNGYVNRPKKIKVTALNENGGPVSLKASGFLSRVLQHEIDHLDGILFIDRIQNKEKIIPVNQPTKEHETDY